MINNKKGFTLVELLAVIVILAIIAIVGTTAIGPVIQNSRKDSIIDEAQTIADAVTLTASMIDAEQTTTCTIFNTSYKTSDTTSVYVVSLDKLAGCGYYKKKNNNLQGYVVVNSDNYSISSYCFGDRNTSYGLKEKSSSELTRTNVTQQQDKTKYYSYTKSKTKGIYTIKCKMVS